MESEEEREKNQEGEKEEKEVKIEDVIKERKNDVIHQSNATKI